MTEGPFSVDSERPLQAFKEFAGSALFTGLLIGIFSYAFLSLYDATQIMYGMGFSIFNLLFYSLVAWMIFVKKNIAWIVPIIVIKYAILIVAIYLVWAHCNALLVAAGMLSELILAAFVWLFLKRVILRRTKNEPL
jgi:hypothetical protein